MTDARIESIKKALGLTEENARARCTGGSGSRPDRDRAQRGNVNYLRSNQAIGLANAIFQVPANAAERADTKFKSHCDRWLAIEPRPRLLELCGQSKQRCLVAVARDELN